ncbi:SDR family NAD(P)-dependent oxidoreductase, partial [Stenotrophomonas indicatrix]
MSFQDKVAIVTGGGRDIGRAVSIKLAAAGARVCLNYANDEASAQETLALIKAAGGQAIAHRADVTDPAAVA